MHYDKVYRLDSVIGDGVNLYGTRGGTNTRRLTTPLDYVLAASGLWTDAR